MKAMPATEPRAKDDNILFPLNTNITGKLHTEHTHNIYLVLCRFPFNDHSNGNEWHWHHRTTSNYVCICEVNQKRYTIYEMSKRKYRIRTINRRVDSPNENDSD